MELAQFALPALATLALGTALLVPLRDDRRGNRATIDGRSPLRAEFRVDVDAAFDRYDMSTLPASEHSANDDSERRSPTLRRPFGDIAGAFAALGRSMRIASKRTTQLALSSAPKDLDASLPPRTESFARQVEEGNAALVVLGGNAQSSETSEPIVEKSRLSDSSRVDRTAVRREVASVVSSTRDVELANGNARPRSFASHVATLFGLRKAALDIANVGEADETLSVAECRSFGAEVEAELVALPRTETPSESALASNEGENAHPEPRSGDDRGFEIVAGQGIAENANATELVVTSTRPNIERIVPLTRLPLRPQSTSITWTGLVAHDVAYDRPGRHALLGHLARDRRDEALEALRIAFREEDAEGRVLALKALRRFDVDVVGRTIFLEALARGSDDERSLAVDALGSVGDREALRRAFDDRVEAIAAKAALAYVDSIDRVALETALAPHVDRARVDAILALLAGVLE